MRIYPHEQLAGSHASVEGGIHGVSWAEGALVSLMRSVASERGKPGADI